jgi:hypothetical protein
MQLPKLTTLISLTTFAAFAGLACGQEPSPPKSDQAPREELTIDVYSFRTFERDGGAIQEMDFARWLHDLREGKRGDDPSRPRVFHRAFALSDAPLTLKAAASESKGSAYIAIEGTVTPMADNRAKVDFTKLGALTLPPAQAGEDRQPVATSLTIQEGQWRVLRLPLVQASSEGRFWNLETIVRLHLEKPSETSSGKSPYEVMEE